MANWKYRCSASRSPPCTDEVVVRIEATPINPTDPGLIFGAANSSTAKVSGTPASPVVSTQIPERLLKGMTGQLGQSLPITNKGAGLVVAAGSSGVVLSPTSICPPLVN